MNRRTFLATTFATFATGTIAAGSIALADPGSTSDKPYTWVFVDDMHCGACAKKIARKLYTVSGVVKVQTHLEKHFAVVTPEAGKTVSARGIWEAVEAAGFTPIKLQGPDGEHTSKPDA